MRNGLWSAIVAIFQLQQALSFPFTFASTAQRPFAPSPFDKDRPIITEETERYIDHLRKRYGLKGLTVAVVKTGPGYEGEDEWLNQTISLGEADVAGNPVTEEVSPKDLS